MKTIGSAARYVDCFEFDRFVTQELGREYDSLRSNPYGYSQDSVETVNTDNPYNDEDAISVVEKWVAGLDKEMPAISLVIEYLFEKGHIAPGLYAIHLWW